MDDDNRMSNRRQGVRRTYDLLGTLLLDEEKQKYDGLLYSRYLDQDRRKHQRRAEVDRRQGEGAQGDRGRGKS